MPETKYEEAKRCPKCQNPGLDIDSKPGPKGSRLHTIQCRNERCRWYDTNYTVQVNADGSIPDPILDRQKSFPALPNRSQEDIDRQMENLYNTSLSGRGETR